MASTASPYGLKAVNHVGGTPYAGSTRLLPIASGYATNLYNGTIVQIGTDGTIQLMPSIGSAAEPFDAGTVGVFVGCTYSDPVTGNLTFNQYWPASTVAADAKAYVVDDPDVVFMVQADASVAQTGLGGNVPLAEVQSGTTGSTVNGNSDIAADCYLCSYYGIALRIVDFVDSPTSTVGDAFTDLLVKFNPVAHSYTNPTGVGD
jgi:hypothetical protein